MTVEELDIVISAQNREFNRAIDDVIGRLDGLEEQSRRTGDSIQGIFGNIAGKLAALGIGKLISNSIMGGGELEQQLGGVEVVFKSHADSMKDAAVSAAENMGLSESAYLASANKMGALFKGSGFDIAYAADMSQQAMQRAADVASIMGVDVSSAMEAVTGAAKGNFTMMDNLGVAMNDTTLQAYAQEKGLGKLETTQQKVGAAMQMFLDKTEYAAGNYSRENDTFSGSLTTLKAEFENLTADLGTTLLPTATTLVSVTRSGLELISPMVISLGEGLNSVAQYLMDLSPSAKTMLGVMVASAVVIPAVTKAQALYNAANAAWKGLLSILIPKQATFNSVLKATFGWLAIIAGVLAIVAQVGAKRRELDSGDLEQTAEDADKASKSTDDLSESMDDLGNSADTAKKKLADIDTLNVFDGSSGSTGGVDFNAITTGAEDASKAVEDAKDQIGDLADSADGFSLDGFADTFSTAFSDIGSGFATIFDAFNFDSDTQLQSLRTLRDMIEDMFGEGFTNFWEGVGATIYNAFNGTETEKSQALGEIQSWLERANGFLTGWMGEFGKAWSDFWKARGTDLYEIFNPGPDPENLPAGYTKYGVDSDGKKTLASELGYRGGGHFRSGESGGGGASRSGYSYADYSVGPQLQTSAWAFPGASYTSNALADSSSNRQPIEIHTTVELDGNAVGESVTTYQERENLHSNGY
ncbi:MAG: hypothetical protein EGR45_08770 [Ruminococcaceae bacterium]|nr:hypothetical protein [Oscillospiraceae bacterium]